MPAELLDGLDMLASLARTALDDPGVMIDNAGRPVAGEDYAIDRCDDIINLLNPAELTNANAAAALTMLGRHIAEIADRLEDLELVPAIREAAAASLQLGLDHVDAAIGSLKGEEE